MMRFSLLSIGQLQNKAVPVLSVNVITLQNELSKQTARSLLKKWDSWPMSQLLLLIKNIKKII